MAMKDGLVTTAQILKAYSTGVIPPGDVIHRLGLTGFSDLMLVMGDHDLPLPRGAGEEDETAREVAEALPLLRANLLPLPADDTPGPS